MIIILPLTDDFNTVSINNIAICEQGSLLHCALASLRDFGRLVCALELLCLHFHFSLTGTRCLQSRRTSSTEDHWSIIHKRTQRMVSTGLQSKQRHWRSVACQLGWQSYICLLTYSQGGKVPPLAYKICEDWQRIRLHRHKAEGSSKPCQGGSYKTIYDEPPLPLFLFKERGGKVVLGTAMSANDNETISYFYYVNAEEEPRALLRYSSPKGRSANVLDKAGWTRIRLSQGDKAGRGSSTGKDLWLGPFSKGLPQWL